MFDVSNNTFNMICIHNINKRVCSILHSFILLASLSNKEKHILKFRC